MAWENGSPEREAALRDINGKGSLDDVLLLMEANLRDCLDALPVDEKPPKFDAFHAGCCALRAYAYTLRLKRQREAKPGNDDAAREIARIYINFRAHCGCLGKDCGAHGDSRLVDLAREAIGDSGDA